MKPFEDLALAALLHLKETNPSIRVWMVDEDFWDRLYHLATVRDLPVRLLPFGSPIPPIRKRKPNERPLDFLDPADTLGVIGRPRTILKVVPTLPQISIAFFAIPELSYSLRIELWKSHLTSTTCSRFCCPFIPFRHYVKLTVGNFAALFLGQPIYETKALKAALASLVFRFGEFARVYSAGQLSTSIANGFLDATRTKAPPGRNILVLIDRTVDLRGTIELHDSYHGYLEECGPWDDKISTPQSDILGRMLRSSVADAERALVFSLYDDVFDQIAFRTLADAANWMKGMDCVTHNRQELRDQHGRLLQACTNYFEHSLVFDILQQVQRDTISAKKSARILAFSDFGAPLAFRMLSVLRILGKKSEAIAIAELLGLKFGIQTLAKWDRIDQWLAKKTRIAPQPPVAGMAKEIPNLVSLLATILNDQWRKGKGPLPSDESFCSSPGPLPIGRFRWFVSVLGGVTATELAMMRETAKRCRPKDEFVFLMTAVQSPMDFMKEVLA